jgi:hypothetical protein
MQKFEGNPTVESKVMAILTRESRLADHTSSSPCCDSIATPKENGFRKIMQKFKRDPTVG